MTNKTKILIVLLIALAIGITIFGVINTNKAVKSKRKGELDEIIDYIDEKNVDNKTNNEENINNSLVENLIIEENNNQVKDENKNEIVVGKEEQESNTENTELKNKQKAIELAKKEWAISVNSYDFQVSNVKEDGTYDVTIISQNSNRTTVAIYNVNVKNEEVIDITE